MNNSKNSEEIKTYVWHIERANFVFDDLAEYEEWKINQKVYFEIDPTNSDDHGAAILDDPKEGIAEFEVNETNGAVSITLEDDGPVISAWIGWEPKLRDGIGDDEVLQWSEEMSGWFTGTISLGDFDASITEDDGGRIFPYTDPED